MRVLKSKKLVAASSAVGVTGVVIAGLLLSAGSSAAETVQVDKTLTYSCPFPLIGIQKLTVQIKTTVETPANEGGELKAGDFTATVTVPETATQGLVLVGAKTVEGTGSAGITLVNAGTTLPISIPDLAVAKTDVPASGTFTVSATGKVPTAFPKQGPTSVSIGNFSTTLTPKTAAGAETGLGTFTSDCTLDPGQDTKILDFTVGPPTGGPTTTVPTSGSSTEPTSGTTEPTSGTTEPTSGTTEPTSGTTEPTTEPTTTTSQPGGGGGQPVTVDKSLNYTCPFPLIGKQTLAVQIKATLTPPAAAGGNLTTSDFSAIATVPETATSGLALVGAKTVEGSAEAKVIADNAGQQIDVTIPGLVVPKTDVPAAGTFTVTASGDVAPQPVPNAGETTVKVGDFTTTLTPKTAAGAETGLGTFTSACTLIEGQDTLLATFTVGTGGGTTTPPTSGSTTPPTSGSTTPPTSGSTTPPTSGSTTPPTSGSTTPPTSGSTTPPTSGTTTSATLPTVPTTTVTTTEPPVLTQDPIGYPDGGNTGGGSWGGGYPSGGSGGGLASTGASIGLPLGIGAALVLAGAGALVWQRRRARKQV
ncbi:DUF6801 domain-containing protein [Actinokineospora bangkokensis]|uniref:DUF6801 domain-containing protein n=1 Tax=Actinokineospora bangkokensis TaxID=1193682 RepID=A0A1Q9LJD1_9PSEU|nr:DUF6801 domain-containing protein [Actinokineospora bangkokensis]OLR92104.1 hypothetical protein BJP25_22425 [Actinokineospora bangkokensis]